MKAARAKPIEPGYDGAEEFVTQVRVTATRAEARILRCRPGTFEWRYARAKDRGKEEKGQAALYHAGVHYAGLWERAGTAAASSPDFGVSGGGAGWRGLPDGRCMAMDELKHAFAALGMAPTSRLTAYCVHGESVTEIADRFGVPSRDMAAVLHLDLYACAMHFHYL